MYGWGGDVFMIFSYDCSMSILFILTIVLQAISVALGVGSSTLAITNFFVAIADGRISEDERKMMGIVYIMLRIAMVIIFITTTILTIIGYSKLGVSTFTPFLLAVWTLIIVLFTNAWLMTHHYMPSTIGPALQASSWYTLGVLMALTEINIMPSSYIVFFLSYLTTLFFAIAVVNGIMAILKHKKHTS